LVVWGGLPRPESFKFARWGPIGAKTRHYQMAGTRARPPAGGTNPAPDGTELTHSEAAEYILSMLEGLRMVAQGAKMPFLAYLIHVALEEANNEKSNSDKGRPVTP
jgi:hypothetical protein